MVRKPTSRFGHIAFGKDGTVNPQIQQLPPSKQEQELRVAEAFTKSISEPDKSREFSARLLDENDHDFALTKNDQQLAIVQMTEIVWQDYASAISQEQYLSGRYNGDLIIEESQNNLLVDQPSFQSVLTEKLERKKAKNYQKPLNHELWLLIWSVRSEVVTFFYEGGQAKTHPRVQHVRRYAEQAGLGPFDQIWFINMNIPKAYRII